MSERIWHTRSLQYGAEKELPLVGHWEVSLAPMSDNYTPTEITAEQLFDRWVGDVTKEYPNGLVPILWYVNSLNGNFKIEFMPFQFNDQEENFLTFYEWPTDPATGEPLNWLTLPVVDLHWNAKHSDKGGFIQEATGWKPSVLQPFVYLKALTDSRRFPSST